MEEKKLDILIQETLEAQADRVSMSPGRQARIKQKIREGKPEEESMMRRFSKKKIIVAAAVMCMLMSVVAVAGGRSISWVSGSNPNRPDITAYTKVRKADDFMGGKVQSVEAFSNGFRFDKGFLSEVKEMNENNQTMGKFPEARLEYKNQTRRVGLSVIPMGKDAGGEKHAETDMIPYRDTNIFYNKDYYKFVPEGYKITPEDQAAMDAGQLYISFGTNEVQMNEICSVSWDAGMHYLLMSSDGSTGKDELIQMAKEVIDAK